MIETKECGTSLASNRTRSPLCASRSLWAAGTYNLAWGTMTIVWPSATVVGFLPKA